MTGATNRRRGLTAERALVTWLRNNGWPQAERTVVTGYRTPTRQRPDAGDITGTPGITWSLKDHATERITTWWTELTNMDGGPIRLLVVKNRGHADPGQWWCWLPLGYLIALTGAQPHPCQDLVRCHLATLAPLLRDAGYGQTPEAVAS
jgi:hypothetical protein